NPSQSGIERREKHILGEYASAGQKVEKRGFASICVSDDRHDRKWNLLALGAMKVACAAHCFQFAFQFDDFFLKDASVGLDLGFARAAVEASAASLPFKVGPASYQAALLIFQMGKLDLQCAFLCLGTLAE